MLTRLLLESHNGRRVESLVIGAAALVPLTSWMYENQIDFSKLRVRAIGTTGFRLGPHWRARVEALWGAQVHDNFSLSELATPASECDTCGFVHFVWPTLVTEVLHPVTERPVRSGCGVLVVTTLWPFVQAMPLIRYWTDDLVERGKPCRARGEPGFRFRGRRAQSIVVGGECLLSPQDIEAVVDGMPEVNRLPHPVTQLGLVQSVDVGVPRFELSREGRRIVVAVEVRFLPTVFPARRRELAEQVAERLRAGSPALRRLLRTRSLVLEVRLSGPNTLKRPWSKF